MRRVTRSVRGLLALALALAVTIGSGCSTNAFFSSSVRSVASAGNSSNSGDVAIAMAPESTDASERAAGGEWRWYRDYAFNFNSDNIRPPDENTAQQIAEYLKQNPALRVALDGAIERRVLKVRSALVDAGVPAGKVQFGAFGDPKRRRDSRVTVLIGE